MGWWNDLTTSIGSALTSLPTEEDINLHIDLNE